MTGTERDRAAQHRREPHQHRQRPGDEPGALVFADGSFDDVHGGEYRASAGRSDRFAQIFRKRLILCA